MHSFKIGDRVVRTTKSDEPEKFGEVGQEYVVKDVSFAGIDIGNGWSASPPHFKLVVSDYKPFGMLSEPDQKRIMYADCVKVYTDEGTWELYELRSFDLGRTYKIVEKVFKPGENLIHKTTYELVTCKEMLNLSTFIDTKDANRAVSDFVKAVSVDIELDDDTLVELALLSCSSDLSVNTIINKALAAAVEDVSKTS